MAGANGDALEWALALAKAPSERLILRQRPLPEGVELLLHIAAGHAAQPLDDAATRTLESRESVLDAVRFYLREVLFHPEADAYRVLGLSRDADPARIKTHHRLLQHWLHPDRQTSEWDAAFAARVNAAWHQLRDPRRRQAYDAAHPTTIDAQPAVAFAPVATGWTHALPDEPLPASERWRQRLPLLGLLLACIALGVLALRDVQRDGQAPVLSPMVPLRDAPATDDVQAIGLDLRPATAPTLPQASKQGPTPVSGSPPAVARARIPDAPTDAMPQPLPRLRDTMQPVAVRVPEDEITTGMPMTAPASHAPVIAARSDLPDPMVRRAPLPSRATASPTQAQVQLAQQVGDRLLVFMRRDNRNVPPIWDSLSAQQGASQIRDILLKGGDARFDSPGWRVDANNAAMRAGIRQADGVEGTLAADLVWREQRWLVRSLSLERDL